MVGYVSYSIHSLDFLYISYMQFFDMSLHSFQADDMMDIICGIPAPLASALPPSTSHPDTTEPPSTPSTTPTTTTSITTAIPTTKEVKSSQLPTTPLLPKSSPTLDSGLAKSTEENIDEDLITKVKTEQDESVRDSQTHGFIVMVSSTTPVVNLTEGVLLVQEVGQDEDEDVLPGLSLPVLIGAAAGGVALLLVVLILIVCLSRRK